jgi:hypothetical protein
MCSSAQQEFAAVTSHIREVGEALEGIGEIFADDVVEERDLRITIPKLEAVIRECASLKYLLEDLALKKNKKKNR